VKAPDPLVSFPLVHHPPIRRSEVVVVEQPVQTFSGSLNWMGPSSLGETAHYTYAADLLDGLVRDRGSKFQKNLVDSGACVHAWFSWPTRRDQAAVSAGFEAAEGNVDACAKALKDELPKLEAPDYFTDEELSNAAHVIDVGQAKSRESTESYAHELTFMWANADLAYYSTYSDRVHAVTRADINAYLDAYVLNKPFVFGVLESPALAKTDTKGHLEGLVGISKGGAK
jgi:zinc protease